MALNSGENRLGRRAILVFRILFTSCLLLTVAFIFLNSAEIGAVSGGRSAAVTEFLNRAAQRARLDFRFDELLVRKLAHFCEYALLGFWLMLTLRVYTRRILSFIAWPLFLGLLTAVLDETLQLFIPGRFGQVRDVAIDFVGVLCGLLAGLFALLLAAALYDAFRGRR